MDLETTIVCLVSCSGFPSGRRYTKMFLERSAERGRALISKSFRNLLNTSVGVGEGSAGQAL